MTLYHKKPEEERQNHRIAVLLTRQEKESLIEAAGPVGYGYVVRQLIQRYLRERVSG